MFEDNEIEEFDDTGLDDRRRLIDHLDWEGELTTEWKG